MTIHLAVKTIHPQISCQFAVVQLTVMVVKLKERAAKVQQISIPRKVGSDIFYEVKAPEVVEGPFRQAQLL